VRWLKTFFVAFLYSFVVFVVLLVVLWLLLPFVWETFSRGTLAVINGHKLRVTFEMALFAAAVTALMACGMAAVDERKSRERR
jgi:ABC-type Fe3+ transport system permease subunit